MLEPLASSTPIIGFKNGGTDGWVTSNTYLYEYGGDIKSVVPKIKELINNNREYVLSNYLHIYIY